MDNKLRSVGLRALVFQRDFGVCALCACDTELTHEVFLRAQGHLQEAVGFRALRLWRDLVTLAGFDARRSTWWEADHKHPLSEGGSHELGNLRTLCIPCHRRETAKLRKRLAKTERQRRKRPRKKYQHYQLSRLSE